MACDLTLLSATPHAPTAPGGFGYVDLAFSTSDPEPVECTAVSLTDLTTHYAPAPGFTGGTGQLTNLLPGSYSFDLRQGQCFAVGRFLLQEAPSSPDPTPDEPARWEPVGGVLPNPVLLKVEASLTDAAGALRPGLHVQVELWQPAALAAFATFKATLRTATQYVDAAPYLRAQLVALPRYPATASAPLVDRDASLRYYYRYRVVDSAGAGPWQQRAGERYAVLAALSGPADTMGLYVADGTGRVASIFPSGEAVQFVGYPLEVSVLLPAYSVPRWAELRYLDAFGKAVEIRSMALAAELPAGYLRLPLPDDPPLCATQLEVSVRDDDRTLASTCGNVLPTPPPSTSGLYSDPLYGIY